MFRTRSLGLERLESENLPTMPFEKKTLAVERCLGYLLAKCNPTQLCGDFLFTPPKLNIAPEKWWLEDYISYWEGDFSGAMLNFREGKHDIRIPIKQPLIRLHWI